MAARGPLSDAQVIEHLLDVVPDVGDLEQRFAADPGQQLLDALDQTQRASVPGFDPVAPDIQFDLPTGEVPNKKAPRLFGQDTTIALVGEAAHSALGKIQREGADAQLTEEERLGLEAVVSVYGRPALLVEGGRFRPPAPPWEKLEQHRPAIEAALRSVCRIEADGHPEHDCLGTGFLVTDDVIMTNRHVAKLFVSLGGPPWQVEPGITVRVDFNEEFLAGEPREHAMTEVVSISTDVDMALLRVAKTSSSGQPLPPPLRISSTTSAVRGSDVYVIGYPLYNPLAAGGNAEALHRIFSDLYGIKRVQPGQVTSLAPDTREIVHDCSTLGGNSGSCLIDLQSGDVIGLHRRGRYLEGNFAVALNQVQDDPALQKANVVFA